MSDYGLLGLAVLAVFANGFFVATEFSLIRMRPTRLQTLVAEQVPGARNVQLMLERLDSYLSATQLGVTLASLALGWVGEPVFARIILSLFNAQLPTSEAALRIVHTLAFVFAFGVISLLHIVVGELTPKNLAIQKTEAIALACAWPMRLFHFIFYPGIWVLNRVASLFLRLLGLRAANKTEERHSEEELRLILSSSAASGAINSSRAEFLERALEMGEKTARQVMVPRNQVRYLDLEEPLEKAVSDARLGGHTWLPLCRGNLDQVVGVVNVKDLFFLLSRGELKSLSQVQRPVLFVPENVTLEQLLSEYRRRKRQMALVVDEHGGTSGIVTVADVVAEVVGDVAELGRGGPEVRTLPGGRLELPGSAQLDDLEDRLDVKFDVEEGEVTTIAGYLMMKLGRIPELGDRQMVGEWEIAVEEMDGPRVVKVRVEPKTKPSILAAPVPPPKLDS